MREGSKERDLREKTKSRIRERRVDRQNITQSGTDKKKDAKSKNQRQRRRTSFRDECQERI